MALLADGVTDVTPDLVSSASQSTLLLVDALVEHIQVLEKEKLKLRSDLDESMAVMKRWRAREEIQQEKRQELERAFESEIQHALCLETENRKLKRRARVLKADMSHTLRASALYDLQRSMYSGTMGNVGIIDVEPLTCRSEDHARRKAKVNLSNEIESKSDCSGIEKVPSHVGVREGAGEPIEGPQEEKAEKNKCEEVLFQPGRRRYYLEECSQCSKNSDEIRHREDVRAHHAMRLRMKRIEHGAETLQHA